MNRRENNDNKDSKELSRCFICDDEIVDRFYFLAKCRTQESRTRVIQKLGELVGERYMVVISEDDVICRSCAMLVNTLDHLETKMRETRNCILHSLEQKYSLQEGELCGNKPKPCQPPQITKADMKRVHPLQIITIHNSESENENDSNPHDSKRTRTSDLLQCNKCKYTTNFNFFMLRHLRNHSEEISSDNYEQHTSGNQQNKKYSYNKADDPENKENKTDNSAIAKNTETKMELFLKQPILSVIQTMSSSLTDSSNYDNRYLTNALPASDSTSFEQSMYSILQSINMTDTDNSRKRTKSDSNSAEETEAKDKGKNRKRLTMREDGTLQITEIIPSKKINIDESAKY